MGLSYVGIADHSRSADYAGGLKAEDVSGQWEAIDRFNAENSDFRFFKGIESDILPDGSLDYDEEILAGFDFVVASVHSGFSMGKADMEARISEGHEESLHDHTRPPHGQASPGKRRIPGGHEDASSRLPPGTTSSSS